MGRFAVYQPLDIRVCLIMGIYSQLWQFHTGNDAVRSLIYDCQENMAS